MKYSEATKAIQGLSKKYSINNDKSIFVLSYKSKPIAWVDKLQQFNFGRANASAPEFDKMPYSHKLWMILAELAMTPLNEREEHKMNEHKWNVVVGNDSSGFASAICWKKSDSDSPYLLCLSDSIPFDYDDAIFTDEEFSDLIKYIKTLPDGEYQAKVAEHGKTLVKGELK